MVLQEWFSFCAGIYYLNYVVVRTQLLELAVMHVCLLLIYLKHFTSKKITIV